MNITQVPNENELKRLFLHYKNFYFSFAIIAICICLVFFFILPQIQQYSDQKAQLQEILDTTAILENNVNTLSSITEKQQTEDYQTVVSALPAEKDYAGILYSVKSASAKSSVGIGDFSFQVGELSEKSVITRSIPYISIAVNLNGSPENVSSFLTQLSKSLPLSNVTEISTNNDYSNVKIDFYYKPISQLRVNYIQPIVGISPANKTILQNLSEWRGQETIFDITLPSNENTASASASPFGQ